MICEVSKSKHLHKCVGAERKSTTLEVNIGVVAAVLSKIMSFSGHFPPRNNGLSRVITACVTCLVLCQGTGVNANTAVPLVGKVHGSRRVEHGVATCSSSVSSLTSVAGLV